MSSPPEPSSTPADADRHRHELGTTLTTLRLRIQLLQRLARQQDGPAWQRMVVGLAAIDADLSTLLRQLADHDRG